MRDTVERCPQSGLASGVYIGNSILFLALILDLKASVPYHHCLADDADYPWLWRFAGTNQPGEQEETEITNKNGTVTKKVHFSSQLNNLTISKEGLSVKLLAFKIIIIRTTVIT